MPKVPTFEQQVSITPKGPSTLVDTDTYAIMGRGLGALYRDEATLWGEVGKAGSALAEVGQKIQQAQDAAQVSKAIGQSYTDLGNMKLEYAGKPEKYTVTDPNTGQSRIKTWEEVRDSIGPEIQALKNNIMQNLSPIGRLHFVGHFDRIAALNKVNILSHAQQRDNRLMNDNFDSGINDTINAVVANKNDPFIRDKAIRDVQMMIQGAKAGGVDPLKIAKIENELPWRIDVAAAQQDMLDNPPKFYKDIQDQTKYPALDPRTRGTLMSGGHSKLNFFQEQNWNDLTKRIQNEGQPGNIAVTEAEIDGMRMGDALNYPKAELAKKILIAQKVEAAGPVYFDLMREADKNPVAASRVRGLIEGGILTDNQGLNIMKISDNTEVTKGQIANPSAWLLGIIDKVSKKQIPEAQAEIDKVKGTPDVKGLVPPEGVMAAQKIVWDAQGVSQGQVAFDLENQKRNNSLTLDWIEKNKDHLSQTQIKDAFGHISDPDRPTYANLMIQAMQGNLDPQKRDFALENQIIKPNEALKLDKTNDLYSKTTDPSFIADKDWLKRTDMEYKNAFGLIRVSKQGKGLSVETLQALKDGKIPTPSIVGPGGANPDAMRLYNLASADLMALIEAKNLKGQQIWNEGQQLLRAKYIPNYVVQQIGDIRARQNQFNLPNIRSEFPDYIYRRTLKTNKGQ